MKIGRCGKIANETTLHQRPNDVIVLTTIGHYGLQQ